jgi:hypothetical protein
MEDPTLLIATDYLNFMQDLKKIDHPSIQNFVLEFDQLFSANNRLQKGIKTEAHPTISFPFPPFDKGQIQSFLERADYKVQESGSPNRHFEFIRQIVDVNVPVQITLQDLFRISEKGLQKNLNEVHKLLEAGQKKEALDLLSILILYAPEYPHLWIIKGVLNYLDKRPNEAILSLLIALYQSPLALHSLIPLLYVLHQTNHSDYLPFKTWFHQHKDKSYTDYDTPKHFKELFQKEHEISSDEELFNSLPKGIGNRYSYSTMKDEIEHLLKDKFPQGLYKMSQTIFDDRFETLSQEIKDPTLRFFLKITKKNPKEIDKEISHQNLYLYSLALASRGFFLGLKIPYLGYTDAQTETIYLMRDLLSASLLLSLFHALLILLKDESIKGTSVQVENIKKLAYLSSNVLPLARLLGEGKVIDALIIDIIERI